MSSSWSAEAIFVWLGQTQELLLTEPTTTIERPRKRKRVPSPLEPVRPQVLGTGYATYPYSMSETESTGGTSQASRLGSRSILVPTPPSTKRSITKRSPSPTRKLLALLAVATPPIRVCQPGNMVVVPDSVSEVRRALLKDVGVGIIPRAVEVKSRRWIFMPKLMVQGHLQRLDPENFDLIPAHMFDETVKQPTPELQELCDRIDNIYVEAERCHNHHKDEAAWTEVVRAVLRSCEVGGRQHMLEINSV